MIEMFFYPLFWVLFGHIVYYVTGIADLEDDNWVQFACCLLWPLFLISFILKKIKKPQ